MNNLVPIRYKPLPGFNGRDFGGGEKSAFVDYCTNVNHWQWENADLDQEASVVKGHLSFIQFTDPIYSDLFFSKVVYLHDFDDVVLQCLPYLERKLIAIDILLKNVKACFWKIWKIDLSEELKEVNDHKKAELKVICDLSNTARRALKVWLVICSRDRHIQRPVSQRHYDGKIVWFGDKPSVVGTDAEKLKLGNLVRISNTEGEAEEGGLTWEEFDQWPMMTFNWSEVVEKQDIENNEKDGVGQHALVNRLSSRRSSTKRLSCKHQIRGHLFTWCIEAQACPICE